MQASPFPHPWSSCSSFHRPQLSQQVTHFPRQLSWLSLPKSSKLRKTRGHLVHRYDRFHTHIWTKHKLIALSLHNHHRLHSPLWLPPFSCWQHDHPRPAKCRLQNPISDSILESCFSDKTKSFICLTALDLLLRKPVSTYNKLPSLYTKEKF